MPLAILFASVLLACGGKKAAPAAPAEAAPASKKGPTGDYPSDAASQAFVETLIATPIHDFAAVDNVGAQLILSTLQFSGDNTWSAVGYVDAFEERMECRESGTWTMDPAESATVATITWVIDQTDCISREAGTRERAQLTIEGDDVRIALR